MKDRPTGISDPWGVRDADKPAAPTPRYKTEEDDTLSDPCDHVRFAGRTRSIHVRPLRGKENLPEAGRAALGATLVTLMKKHPRFSEVLKTQSLSFEPPVGPHVILELGLLKLYAGTPTTDSAVAQLMAIDRLAYALTAARSQNPDIKRILDQHRVEITNK